MTFKMMIATTESIPGHAVSEYKGLVWASSARSRNAIMDMGAVMRTLAGGEIKIYNRMLNDARAHAIKTLSENAFKMGANAIVGVRFGSTQIISSTVEVTAYGTAVVVKSEKRK